MNWRPLLINPLLVLATAGTGVLACRAASTNWHRNELVAAAGAFLLSAEVAVLLVIARRDQSPVGVAQAALIALGAHLLLSLILSAALMLSGQVGRPFVWWAMAMFWATLIGVSVVLIRAVRGAAAAFRSAAGDVRTSTSDSGPRLD